MSRDGGLKPPSSLVDPATGLAIADYSSLPLECHSAFQKIFETDTGLGGVYFLAEALKFNKKFVEQRRVVVITRDALYLCTPRAEVLRCSKLELIQETFCFGSIAAFKIPDEYDIMLRVTKNNRSTDTAVITYMKYVLKRLTNLEIHENQAWLDTKASATNRDTVKSTLQLGRDKGWMPMRPLPIVKFAWKDLVLRPGFEDTWRKLHPSRSKQVWELKEYYEKERRTENYVEETKFSVRRRDPMQPSPPTTPIAPTPSLLDPSDKQLGMHTSVAATPKEPTTHHGVFDIISAAPMAFQPQSPARGGPRFSRATTGGLTTSSPPRASPPRSPPPDYTEPLHYKMPSPRSASGQSGVVMAEGRSQYFPPSPRGGSVPMSHPAPLDPFLIELAAAASPVPYNVYELEQAARVTKDREGFEVPTTPTALYEPSPRKNEALSERLLSSVGRTAGVRPGAMAPPPGLSTPATHYWSHAEEPRSAEPQSVDPLSMESVPRDAAAGEGTHTKAADMARAFSEATKQPGGGGVEARKAISDMLRTTAALLNAEDSVKNHEEKIRTLGMATPSPGGVRGQTSDPRLQTLIGEQERQRLGLESVCKKLDALLQPQVHDHSPAAQSPVGHWEHEDPLETNSLIGTSLLPLPRHSLSKYQQSLKSSIRPLASTPPAAHRASPHRSPRARRSRHR